MLKKKDKVMPVRIDADLHERIKVVASSQGIPLSQFMRQMIENVCEQYDQRMMMQRARENFKAKSKL